MTKKSLLFLALFVLTAASAHAFTLKINLMTGRYLSLDAKETATILSIKEKIKEKEGIAVETQRLVFGGTNLQDAKTLGDYGIKDGDTLLFAVRFKQ